ncbi:MAG: MlaD family protein [Pseudomonadota bacterium]
MSKIEVESIPARRFSRVWIVPIIAAVIGALVIWQSYANRGPLVEIRFEQGRGITAGKTEIRHKDVVVGLVETVTLGEDLQTVIVKARMDKFMAPYLGDATSFWIVSANISGTSLTGLSTILSGSYIEVEWASGSDTKQRRFDGLDQPPMTPPGVAGTRVSLTARTAGSVTVGSPLYYKKIKVGRIESRALSEDFQRVEYTAFIEAPYDTLLNPTTHFWNTSGVRVEAGSNGLTINFESVQSLLSGGIAFGNIGRSLTTTSIEPGTTFRIYASRADAVDSQFDTNGEPGSLYMATFTDSVAGLEPGAPVEWQGIKIGSVHDIVLDLDKRPTERGLIYVVIEMQPARVGLDVVSDQEQRDLMFEWVNSGMRLQLATGNILSGRKMIKAVDGIGEDDFRLDFAGQPYPELPTTRSELGAVAQNVDRVVANIAALPLDQLVGSLIEVLDDTGALLSSDATRAIPETLEAALSGLNRAIGNVDSAARNLPALIDNLNQIAMAGESTLSGLSPDSELYVDLSAAVRELRDATSALAALARRLEEQPNSIITGR